MFKYRRPWLPVYEGETPPGDAAGDPPPEPAKPGKVEFSEAQQLHMNKVVAEEKRKHQAHTNKVLEELKAVQSRSDLTQKEREELELRLDDVQASLRTKEELARTEVESLKKKMEQMEVTSKTEIDVWRDRFRNSTVERAIIDAATTEGQEAFHPSQIVSIILPLTRLTEQKDEVGTIQYEVRTKLNTTNEKGEPVELDFTVQEAVKQMSTMPMHANLFKAATASGLGLGTAGKSEPVDVKELAKDPKKIREHLKREGIV